MSTDAYPLLYLRKEPPPRAMAIVDALSWWLPGAAGALSIGAGIAALNHMDALAAQLGMVGGGVGLFGVLFANWASCREQRN